MSCLLAPPFPNLPTETLLEIYQRNETELKCAGFENISKNSTPEIVPLSNTLLFNLWGEGSVCPSIFQSSIYSAPSVSGSGTTNNFSPTIYGQVQQEMTNVLYQYFSSNPFVDSTYHSPALQNELLSTCVQIPGICGVSESSQCGGCSRDEIANSFNLLEYCGCYSPPDPQFNDKTVPQCDYLCTNAASSKLRDVTSGGVLQCGQTSCVINNISITGTGNAAGSGGSVSFEQVCSQCSGSDGCKCFIDVSVPNVISNLGLKGEATFTNSCPYSECYTTDVNGQNPVIVDCNQYVNQPVKVPLSTSLLWFLLFLFVLGLFVIYSFKYWGENFRQSSFRIWKPKPIPGNGRGFSSADLFKVSK